MIKKISIIIVFLLLICGISTADNYIINGDIVYIDDSKVYLSATPHTLSCSEWVYFNLTSKVYTGNIDACWGFNTSVSKPAKVEVYNPYWVNTTTNHQKTFYNSTHVVYIGNDLNYGNFYNTNYKYTITESIVNENGTIYITSNAAFDSFDTDGTNYTIYWYTCHDNHYLWKDFSLSFSSVIYDYEGYNKWYYIKNISIISDKEYTVRAWIDVPISTEKQFGKYYFAIKPSGETISQAVNNGHFYNLDPWWNATWSNRKEITLTGNTSGAQTDYQLLLNVTYEPEMQSDFDDLRFCNETHELDSWLESKVDDSYALVWVEFPTTPANGVNQTYYIYYGNAGAASNWDIGATFLFGDDFPGSSIDTNKWILDGTPNVSSGIVTIVNNGIHGKSDYGINHACRFRTKAYSPVGGGNWDAFALFGWDDSMSTTTPYEDFIMRIGYNSLYVLSAEAYSSDLGTAMLDAWATYEIIRKATSHEFLIEGVSKHTEASPHTGVLAPTFWSDSIKEKMEIDWVFLHKYAANPPTYAFGSSEEHYISPAPTTLINETKLIMSEITTGLKGVNMSNYLVYAFILIGILLIILGIQIITNNIYRG